MLNEDMIKDAISEMKHCVEIGNILFQMPGDEKVIATIMVGLKKQVSKKPIVHASGTCQYCKECGEFVSRRDNYCRICGQKLDWEDCKDDKNDKA